jgi:NitT/TauT family transport system permease protein
MNQEQLNQLYIEEIKRKNKEQFKLQLIAVLSVVCFILIWEVVVKTGLVNARTLPAPSKVIQSLIVKTHSKAPDGNTLMQNIVASLKVALSGFLIAVVLGIPLGLVMGWYKGADKFLTPLFELIRPVPPIAWIPLVVLWMGIGLKAKALIIFFSAFVPCVINSYTGIKMTNPVLINVSRTFGASNFKIFRQIGIPSSLPMVMAGVKLALGNSWSTLVAAELLAANAGLGFMIQMGRQLARADVVVMGMLIIGILGAILTLILTKIENHLLRWKVNR